MTAAAAVAALAGWGVGRVALGDAPVAGGSPVGAVQVVVVTVLAALAAWAGSAALGRRGASGRRVWWLLAVGVALVSLLGPLTQARGGSTVVLMVLHVVVTVVLVVGFGGRRG